MDGVVFDYYTPTLLFRRYCVHLANTRSTIAGGARALRSTAHSDRSHAVFFTTRLDCFRFAAPVGGARYCDEAVRMSVCISVCCGGHIDA